MGKWSFHPACELLEARVNPSADPLGAQFLVNETIAPPENPPAVAILDAGTGDFIAVWQSYGEDGDGYGIFAQIFDGAGHGITGQETFQVNQAASLLPDDPALGNQMAPTVAADGMGNFVIAWQSENQATGDYDVFYRLGYYDAALSTRTLQDQDQANTLFVDGDQLAPTAAMDGSENFVIAWQGQNAALDFDIYAKRGTVGDGLPGDDEFPVNTDNTAGDQTNPAAAIDTLSGAFVVAWRGPDPESSGEDGEEVPGILFNVFYDDGGGDFIPTGEVRANDTVYNDLSVPDVAMNTAGDIVVVWQVEGLPESGSDVFGRRFAFDGSTVAPVETVGYGTGDFRLNEVTLAPQRAPTVGLDDAGNFFAAWQSQHQDGFSWAIYGRRFDAAAVTDPFSPEELVNQGTQNGPQILPDLAMTGAGRTVVIWLGPYVPDIGVEGEGGHSPAVHAHVYDDAGGTSLGVGEVFLAKYVGIEESPVAAAADAAGNFVVVWQSWEEVGDGSDFGIYAKLYQANGKPLDLNGNGLDDDALLVNQTTIGSQTSPAVAMDAAGNFVVVWQSALQDGSGAGIYARRYDASYKGWLPEGEFLINVTTEGDQVHPKVAMDAAGNFVVIWESKDGLNSKDDSDSTGIFGRRYDLHGTPVTEEFRVNCVADYDQNGAAVAMNPAGQFVVVWVSDHNVLANELDSEKSVFVRWFDADGTPLGKEQLVHEYTKDAQEHPAVGIEANGDFVVAWQSINQEMNAEGIGNSWGVYARQFEVDVAARTITSPQDEEFRVNETTDGPQRYPSIGVDHAGNFVVAWQSIRQDGSSWALLGRQYDALGLPEGPETLINTHTSGPQILPVIAGPGTGDYEVFWSGQAPGHLEGVSGRRYHWLRDDFDRNNQPSLGPDWTVRVGNFDIHDDQASVQSDLALATLNSTLLADVAVEGRVVLGGGLTQMQGVLARYAGPGIGNFYWGTLVGREGSFTAEIWRNLGGAWTKLAGAGVAAGSGLLRFEVVGSSLKLFLNGKLAAFAFDDALPAAGLMGMLGTFDTSLDDFTFAALTAVDASLPFRDFFTLADASQPDRFWMEHAGNFAVDDQAAVAQGTVDLITLSGQNLADVAVSMHFDVTAMGSAAGLVTRYAGPGDANMYFGAVGHSAAGYQAFLWRNVGGAWTMLAAQPIAGDGTGTLRFETVGTELRLFLDGVLVASATDTGLEHGTLGIRTSAGAVVDDFAIAMRTPKLPFADPFTQADGTALSPYWLDRVDTFTVQGEQAVPQTGYVALTALNGLNLADVSVSAVVDVTAAGAAAGLVTRYSGPGDTDMYVGVLANNGSEIDAFLWKNVAGDWTMLAMAGGLGATGTLRFDAVGTELRLYLDGVLVVAATDADLTSGTVGLRASAGVAFDDVAVQSTTPTLPFADPFTQADGTALSPFWLDRVDSFTVQGEQAVPQTGYVALTALNGLDLADASVSAVVDVAAAGAAAGLVTRYSGPGDANQYVGVLANNGSETDAFLWKNVAGDWTMLAMAGGLAATGTLRFDAVGTELRLYLDGVLVVAATDADLTSGTVGLRASAGAAFDDVAVRSTTPTLPFADPFTQADGTALSPFWLDRVDSFTVQGEQAVPQTGYVALTALNGLNLADVSVSAVVDVTAAGAVAGLVTRYSGSEDTDMYVGILANNGLGLHAFLWKNVGGTWTMLKMEADIAGPATGTLRFDAIGTTLNLYLEDTLIATATDGALTSGTVGMRGTDGASFDDFTVDGCRVSS